MLWKCTVCQLIKEGAEAPDKCPKCGVPKEKFVEMSQEATVKIYSADRTNDLLMHINKCAAKLIKLCEEGIEIGLDPGCTTSFNNSKNLAWDVKQIVKAEIATHVGKEKF